MLDFHFVDLSTVSKNIAANSVFVYKANYLNFAIH